MAGEPVARIGRGWLALVGVGQDDSPATARALAEKVAHLRAFPDAEGRMNRSALAFCVGCPTSALLIWTPRAINCATYPCAAYCTP